MQNRQARLINREQIFRDRTNPLDAYCDEELYKRCRFDRAGLMYLCDLLREDLETAANRSSALPIATQVYVAVRYLAAGALQLVTADTVVVSQPSVSRCVKNVVASLAEKLGQFVRFPTLADETTKMKQDFYKLQKMPGIVGALDCTHVKIKAPGNDEQAYVNRKNFHSINVQAICNADRRFVNVVACWPGRAHDSRIFTESRIGQEFAVGRWNNCILLGDKGYGLQTFLLTPYNDPHSPAQRRYNAAHMRTRVRIEQAFGVLKRRFAILHTGIRMFPNRACLIITACFVLYNILLDRRPVDAEEVPEPVIDDTHEIQNRQGAAANRISRAFRDAYAHNHFGNV